MAWRKGRCRPRTSPPRHTCCSCLGYSLGLAACHSQSDAPLYSPVYCAHEDSSLLLDVEEYLRDSDLNEYAIFHRRLGVPMSAASKELASKAGVTETQHHDANRLYRYIRCSMEARILYKRWGSMTMVHIASQLEQAAHPSGPATILSTRNSNG